ncbi:hypothetical protein UFOVP1613_16 [uncultured Caudovirales phage]|uniref:Uncharacterized protein n=1 Tax=uncultured Caudovirales phage TaxID=2100421 RepID=A0A6J5SUW2_9CAUD|nr:hypothetical protein UFOVP1163_18 [uncultured Caudovirales phage]CAB4219263.1 hypothetical protein UFOVP1613_16 [uncultured Caudovirales phage]
MTQAFNLAQLANNLNTSGQLDATDGLSGVLPVANGGTGGNTLAANNVLIGNGTSTIAGVAPGSSGNVLQSNGTTWQSVANQALGFGQTWQNMGRSADVTYTNSTGRPIMVAVYSSAINYSWIYWYVAGSNWGIQGSGGSGASQFSQCCFVVPAGATYSVSLFNGSIGTWAELR